MTCCFIGHRKIEEKEKVKERIRETVELLITRGVTIFYFGSRSEFDDLCHSVVTEFKEKYSEIKRIYIRAEYAYIDDFYKKHLLEAYEDTYMPEEIEEAGNASYVKRNRVMIDSSEYCVFFYFKDYKPEPNPYHKSSGKSGTKLAYDYAVRKKKKIINLAGV